MAAQLPPFIYYKMDNIISYQREAEGWLISIGGTPGDAGALAHSSPYRKLLVAFENG
ncbi:MAG: hypothetical protein IPH54_20680 [Rhodoferax sp.]|nr:hypothetical protein [Rhodoferax sp.]